MTRWLATTLNMESTWRTSATTWLSTRAQSHTTATVPDSASTAEQVQMLQELHAFVMSYVTFVID